MVVKTEEDGAGEEKNSLSSSFLCPPAWHLNLFDVMSVLFSSRQASSTPFKLISCVLKHTSPFFVFSVSYLYTFSSLSCCFSLLFVLFSLQLFFFSSFLYVHNSLCLIFLLFSSLIHQYSSNLLHVLQTSSVIQSSFFYVIQTSYVI